MLTTYLLRDNFTTDDNEPITTPRTCEPGPGTLTMVQTATNDTYISGGKYVETRPSAGHDYAGLGFVSVAGYERRMGRALYVKQNFANKDQVEFAGWADSSTMATQDGAEKYATYDTYSNSVDYEVALISRSFGSLSFVKGGAFTDWTLSYVSYQRGFIDLYPRHRNYNGAVSIDEFSLVDKSGKFATDYGPCSVFDPVPASGDSATMPADALMYFHWTPAAGETLIWRFRRTDDDNCYRLECDQAAGTIKLFKRESGSDTELDAGKTQTWAVSVACRIAVICIGSTILTQVQVSNAYYLTAKHTATDQTFNESATGTTIAGFAAGANWEIWPRAFSGDGIWGLT